MVHTCGKVCKLLWLVFQDVIADAVHHVLEVLCFGTRRADKHNSGLVLEQPVSKALGVRTLCGSGIAASLVVVPKVETDGLIV